MESRTHIGYSEMYKEEWDVLEEEMREIDQRDTEEFTINRQQREKRSLS